MINTSLCYVEKNGKYLMLHRVKKENDENRDKWIGVGGKFENGESPEQCAIREVFEETGLTVKSWRYRGIVTFVSDRWPCEYMHLFTCDDFAGELTDCDEGELEWVDKRDMKKLNLWAGDYIFLELIEKDMPFFSLRLQYKGEALAGATLNGENIRI